MLQDTSVEASLVAIAQGLHSPNELDTNYEPANVVDGLFAIARALDRVADAILVHGKLRT